MATYDRDYDRRRGHGYGPAVRRKGAGLDWLWWLLGLAALVIAAVLLIGLFEPEAEGVGVAPGIAAPAAAGAEIADILDNPIAWAGRPVAVSGEVEEVLGPRMFVLENGGLFFDDQILVVSAANIVPPANLGRPAGAGLLEDDELRVAGTVTILNTVADLEREVGFDLDDALLGDFVGRPVIVAREVAFGVAAD